jgi:hypothetical protein
MKSTRRRIVMPGVFDRKPQPDELPLYVPEEQRGQPPVSGWRARALRKHLERLERERP